MKLHVEPTASLNTVTAYGPGYVEINAKRFEHPLLVMPESVLQAWHPRTVEDLQQQDFSDLLGFEPALVVLGTGERQHFIHPRLYSALSQRHIGVEMMDSKAACRTYNILMAEGRRVLAAILV